MFSGGRETVHWERMGKLNNISREIYTDLSNFEVPFLKKMKSFLVKGFYLNFVE